MWGLILFSKTYLLDVSAWEVIRALLPFRGWGRRELGCRTGRQQHRAARSESHPVISRVWQQGQEGKEAGFYSPQLMSLLATARHLCLKSHQLFVIMLRVTLEMSTASWHGFKHSGPCLWWSPNMLLFTGTKNKVCFPRAENLACTKRQVFPNCFPGGRYPWFTQWLSLLP